MSHSHLAGEAAAGGGCWTCAYWRGRLAGPGHPVCDRDPGRPTVTGQPQYGCVYWEREPGADDEVPPPCSAAET